MIQTSDAYKEMMKKPIRNRGYISVALGVINQNAQGDVDYYGNSENYGGTYYSRGDVFKDLQSSETYGSLEHNFTKADGKFLFVPRENTSNAFHETGYISNGFAQVFDWNFNAEHDIKGLTIEFEPTSYPLGFSLTTYGTDGDTYHFDNDNYIFETDTTFGNVSQFVMTVDPDYEIADNAVKMSGGAQYLHIRRILCGIGVNFQGDTIESAELESFISGISAEVSYKDLSLSVIDAKNAFDVDQTESFINYLEPLQPMAVSIGVDLDDGTKEWFQVANCKLKEWSSRQGKVRFTATDYVTQCEEEYSNMILQSRSASDEFEAIFTSMGLTADDYVIDRNLIFVLIENPIEANTQKECLQLLANATRSIIYEDENGIIHVEQAFDRCLPPSNLHTETENIEYVDAEYVSERESDEDGDFVDKTLNLYNCNDENNSTNNYGFPLDSNIQLGIDKKGFEFLAPTTTTLLNGSFYGIFSIGQMGKHSPFKDAGVYTIMLSAENGLATVEDMSAEVTVGNDQYIGQTSLMPNVCTVEITDYHPPYAFETFNLRLDIGTLYAKNKGVLRLMIYKGEPSDQIEYVPYRYDLRYPTLTQSWDTPIEISMLKISFDTVPQNVVINGYNGTTNVLTTNAYPTRKDVYAYIHPQETKTINKVTVEVRKGTPNSKIAIVNTSIGSDIQYTLAKNDVFDTYKAKEPKVKAVKVKIYTYEEEDGEIRLVDDDVWYTETLGVEGIEKTAENPLISSQAQAELVAKWIADYYSKQKTYDIDWRGDPSLQAHDLVKLESEFSDLLAVNVEQTNISFNGAFHGHMNARQAN